MLTKNDKIHSYSLLPFLIPLSASAFPGIFWAAGVKIRDSKEKSWVKKRKEWDHSPREAVELASSPGEGDAPSSIREGQHVCWVCKD